MTDWPFQLTTDISIFTLLVAVVGLVSLIFIFRLGRMYQKVLKQLMQLQNEVRAMSRGNLGMGRKISKVSKEVANVESLQQENLSNFGKDKKYEQAGLLLSRGVSIDEVVESCDIAPAEAELLAIMQKAQQSGA